MKPMHPKIKLAMKHLCSAKDSIRGIGLRIRVIHDENDRPHRMKFVDTTRDDKVLADWWPKTGTLMIRQGNEKHEAATIHDAIKALVETGR